MACLCVWRLYLLSETLGSGSKIEFLCKKLSTYFQLHKGARTQTQMIYHQIEGKKHNIYIYTYQSIYMYISHTHIRDTRNSVSA